MVAVRPFQQNLAISPSYCPRASHAVPQRIATLALVCSGLGDGRTDIVYRSTRWALSTSRSLARTKRLGHAGEIRSEPAADPGYCFPAEIISYAVWLYRVFGLSLRDVELIL